MNVKDDYLQELIERKPLALVESYRTNRRAYLDAHAQEEPRAEVQVPRGATPARRHARVKVSLVTAAALVGRRTSERKAARHTRYKSGRRAFNCFSSMNCRSPSLRQRT